MENKTLRTADFSPHIKTYILFVVAFFLTISIAGIPLLLVWFLGFGQYFSKRYLKALSCRLTEQHLEFKKGVFFQREKTIPLENIQDLTFIQNPILNWFHLKILKIETAGQGSPQGMSDMKLIGIIDADTFKKEVLDQRALLKENSQAINKSTANFDEQTISLLTEIRDLLAKTTA